MGEDTPPPADAVRLDALPMGESRTDAYQIVRAAGPIARSARGAYLLTSAELAEYALKHPELFSSKPARKCRSRSRSRTGTRPSRCLGSHLARMEMREVLREWHRRIPEYQLAPGTVPRVAWPIGLVGLDRLPLVFPPGGGGRR